MEANLSTGTLADICLSWIELRAMREMLDRAGENFLHARGISSFEPQDHQLLRELAQLRIEGQALDHELITLIGRVSPSPNSFSVDQMEEES